jgi:hypothetical protein
MIDTLEDYMILCSLFYGFALFVEMKKRKIKFGMNENENE